MSEVEYMLQKEKELKMKQIMTKHQEERHLSLPDQEHEQNQGMSRYQMTPIRSIEKLRVDRSFEPNKGIMTPSQKNYRNNHPKVNHSYQNIPNLKSNRTNKELEVF
mmetsp:Transcript_6834/g.6057  ORF Transcript_6834/g.6057 Transcript_6834/m.6057 type:complete len:106 (-) Transcript_6834:283-600(-)